MEWVETTGRSVEEAKDEALDQLGVDEQDAEFEVLEEPRPGLFGRLRGEARVRARVRPVQARPKAERRRSRGRRGESGAPTPAPAERAAAEEADEAEEAEEVGSLGADDTDRPAAGDERSAAAPSGAAASTPRSGGGGRRRRRRGGRGRSGSTTTSPDQARTHGEEPTMTDDQLDLDTQATIVRDFLDGLVEAFDLEGELSVVRIDDETAEVRVEGDDLGLLVGPRGTTLQAINELSRTVVQRSSTGPVTGRVRVDVAGYRERRRVALERFTREVAARVIERGQPQVLEPMAPPDRKVVHDVVNTIDGVTTESEGEEPERRVVIVPED